MKRSTYLMGLGAIALATYILAILAAVFYEQDWVASGLVLLCGLMACAAWTGMGTDV